MFPATALLAFSFLAAVLGQQVGTQLAETHPALSYQTCTAPGSCTTNAGQVTLDANWRWLHTTTGYTNCYTGNAWDATLCPDGATCATNCALDGADYSGTYGVTTSGASLKLDFVTTSTQTNVGSRLYLMSSATEYELFKPLNQEFTFDVDVSALPCGLNGAVYFSEMSADGGLAAYSGNKAGAKYGTGYCDSQCPRDLKFINGVGNVVGWNATSTNSGTGNFGSCCNEMDIWEANSVSAAFTPHPCTVVGQTECAGTACATTDRYGSACDPDGCDFNSYRQGNTGFYGPGKTVDTTKPFTIVTQFHTSDNTSTGTLTEIKRLYVQNGVVIQNSQSTIAGITGNSITTAYCDAQKTVFGDTNDFDTKGGLPTMGKSLARGVVLVLSVWDDYAVNMLWLDSDYPTTADATTPGVARGTCATTSGVPADVEKNSASASVTYSNIKVGPIGSTYTGGGGTGTGTTSGTGTGTTTSSAPSATQTKYGQCGGSGYTGPTTCAAGSTCKSSSAYYSQCL
ncbi:carbohydrate-binding module family 1 protein [Athelia psychrophila]|uniref:Glucanase n=1 Tax=Athelia psychrophila TaxID=1759441 RepID=A0A166SDY2_9AGAM|nr:carbohydrate-binding module family 1 protein [Fibularhizoctonia sp. CBS 109695]